MRVLLAFAIVLWASAVGAQVTPQPGYIYSTNVLTDTTQSCVASASGATFVAVGPAYTGQGQSVLRLSAGGDVEATVVSGLNSISDCVWDAALDTLYIADNGLEAAGAVTGDTVFAVASASTASGLSAVGLEVLPAGSIPSAFGVALDAAGSLYVTDSAGAQSGSVTKISAGVATSFIPSGFDFTSGIAIDATGDVFVAESLPTFENQIRRYDAAGAFQDVESGPTYAHGSYDMAFRADGSLLVTGVFGGDIVSLEPSTGASTPFASGLTYASGIAVREFTGRVDVLSSTFVSPDPPDEDYSVHSFTPIGRLVAGNGASSKNCVSQAYGIELVAPAPGKPAKKAICTDGAPCDADGQENGQCLFPVGFCLNVDDPALPDCSSAGLASFELKRSSPPSSALETVAAAIQAQLPLSESTCFFSDGITVPVKNAGTPKEKAGKGLVKTKAASTDAKALKDSDTFKLVCEPGAP
jgi:hypothetical protein